jgi:hypothetical protein
MALQSLTLPSIGEREGEREGERGRGREREGEERGEGRGEMREERGERRREDTCAATRLDRCDQKLESRLALVHGKPDTAVDLC